MSGSSPQPRGATQMSQKGTNSASVGLWCCVSLSLVVFPTCLTIWLTPQSPILLQWMLVKTDLILPKSRIWDPSIRIIFSYRADTSIPITFVANCVIDSKAGAYLLISPLFFPTRKTEFDFTKWTYILPVQVRKSPRPSGQVLQP